MKPEQDLQAEYEDAMREERANASAFPAAFESSDGLTKREYMATAFMAALIGEALKNPHPVEALETPAQLAVMAADSLLAELEK